MDHGLTQDTSTQQIDGLNEMGWRPSRESSRRWAGEVNINENNLRWYALLLIPLIILLSMMIFPTYSTRRYQWGYDIGYFSAYSIFGIGFLIHAIRRGSKIGYLIYGLLLFFTPAIVFHSMNLANGLFR